MDDERKASPWIAWCSGIVVLLGLYVGAYAALVERMPIFGRSGPYAGESLQWGAQYRIGYPITHFIFGPIERIDRRFRCDFWEDKAATEFARAVLRMRKSSLLEPHLSRVSNDQ